MNRKYPFGGVNSPRAREDVAYCVVRSWESFLMPRCVSFKSLMENLLIWKLRNNGTIFSCSFFASYVLPTMVESESFVFHESVRKERREEAHDPAPRSWSRVVSRFYVDPFTSYSPLNFRSLVARAWVGSTAEHVAERPRGAWALRMTA